MHCEITDSSPSTSTSPKESENEENESEISDVGPPLAPVRDEGKAENENNPKKVSGDRAKTCRDERAIQCQNGGICQIGKKNFAKHDFLAPFGNGPRHINGMHCVCPDEFTGIQCEVKVDICVQNKHACFNGGSCKPDESADFGYTCDCNVGANDPAAIGEHCENLATTSCEANEKFSKHAFCTNGGECKDIVTGTSA